MPLVTFPCVHEASSTSLGNALRVWTADSSARVILILSQAQKSNLIWPVQNLFVTENEFKLTKMSWNWKYFCFIFFKMTYYKNFYDNEGKKMFTA